MQCMQYLRRRDDVFIQAILECVSPFRHQGACRVTNRDHQFATRVPNVVSRDLKLLFEAIRGWRECHYSRYSHSYLQATRFDGNRLRAISFDQDAPMRIRRYRKDAQEPFRQSHGQVDMSDTPTVVVGALVDTFGRLSAEGGIAYQPSRK